MSEENTTKIRELNDRTRQQLFVPHFMRPFPCQIVHTQGIEAFSEDQRHEIYVAVAEFDDFTEDNDPYGEHDFGLFDYDGHKIYWKIDYYDNDLQFGSEDPADIDVTTRVLTILLSSEY